MQPTPRSQIAFDHVKTALITFGHTHASSAHLILGLLTLHGGVASNVLRRAGFTPANVQSFLAALPASAAETTMLYGLPAGPSACSALERAQSEARAMQHSYLGVEHILLGILAEEKGEAADLIHLLRIDASNLRTVVLNELQSG